MAHLRPSRWSARSPLRASALTNHAAAGGAHAVCQRPAPHREQLTFSSLSTRCAPEPVIQPPSRLDSADRSIVIERRGRRAWPVLSGGTSVLARRFALRVSQVAVGMSSRAASGSLLPLDSGKASLRDAFRVWCSRLSLLVAWDITTLMPNHISQETL